MTTALDFSGLEVERESRSSYNIIEGSECQTLVKIALTSLMDDLKRSLFYWQAVSCSIPSWFIGFDAKIILQCLVGHLIRVGQNKFSMQLIILCKWFLLFTIRFSTDKPRHMLRSFLSTNSHFCGWILSFFSRTYHTIYSHPWSYYSESLLMLSLVNVISRFMWSHFTRPIC
jgi:hypothetical protein